MKAAVRAGRGWECVFGALEFCMLAAGDTPSKKLFESYQIFALTAQPGAKVQAHSRLLPLVALQG
jgi:hypothetical protein